MARVRSVLHQSWNFELAALVEASPQITLSDRVSIRSDFPLMFNAVAIAGGCDALHALCRCLYVTHASALYLHVAVEVFQHWSA